MMGEKELSIPDFTEFMHIRGLDTENKQLFRYIILHGLSLCLDNLMCGHYTERKI